jgi:hypothetical protein
MRGGYFLIMLFSICFLLPLSGQEPDIVFSGNFRDLPLVEFVEELESRTEVRFYYREEWIRGIRITVSGENLSLRETLGKILEHTGLSYFIDPDNQVFITDQGPVIARLPDYSGSLSGNKGTRAGNVPEAMTSIERKYIEGRREGMLETLTVGNQEEINGMSSAVIHGKLTDAETGEPLIGATIYFEELKKGAATDVDGRFSIVVKPGRYTVEFNCMGMEDRHHILQVYSGGDLAVPMNQALIPITEVVIKANRYHNVRGTQMGFDRLNYKVLKEVPVVMGEKDILKVVQLLPGVQSVGEGATGFNVRGSAADQNMIYIQKVPVYNSSHLFGFFTSFSPEIVKDFTLYKSNLPATFGGRLASFFDISTRQGNMNKYTARGGISPVTGNLAVEGPIRKENSSFIVTMRSTYSDWILNQIEDPVIRNSDANFYDVATSLSWEPGQKTLVKAFGYYSSDHFNLGTTNQYEYSNAGASVSVRHRFTPRSSGEMALVFGNYDFTTIDQIVPYESYSHHYRIDHYEIRADMTWLSLGKHMVTYGASSIFYNLDRGSVDPYGPYSLRNPVELGIDNGIESALYLADEIALLPRLTLYGGLRFATYLALGPEQVLQYQEGEPFRPEHVVDTIIFEPGKIIKTYTSLEPRLALNFMVGDNSSLKLSYNRVRQFLFMLSNTIAVSPSDQWKLCDYHITPPYIDQLSLGYYQDVPRGGLSMSLEIYYKWVSDVVEYRDGASFISSSYVERVILQGEQRAYGVEAMIRKTGGQFNGWLAYSYSRSFMQFKSSVPGEQINGGDPYPSNYDRPHNVSLVTNLKVNRRLSLSANVVYITGRPITYPVSIYYMEGMEFIDYSARNSYRIPDYFRIDFSINLEGNLRERKLFHSYWMLNFYNITGRENAYSVYFQSEDGVIQGYKLSIFAQPVITLSWNFKLGNYASE